MKKLNTLVALGFVAIASVVVYAGNQYNWGNSTGGSWSTPDDTTVTASQVLSIGTSGGSAVIAANSISIGSSSTAFSTATTAGNSNGAFGTAYLSGTVAAIEGSVLCSTTAVTGLQAVVVCPTSTATTPRVDWVGISKNAASTGSVVNVYYSGFVLVATSGTVVAGNPLGVSPNTAGYLESTSALLSTNTVSGVVAISMASGVSAGGLTKARIR